MDHNDYKLTAPELLRNFLVYHETIQGHSKKTVDEYYLDLRNFFRYIKIEKGRAPRTAELDETIWIWTWPSRLLSVMCTAT